MYGMKGLHLAKVSCEGMVMQVLKNTESYIPSFQESGRICVQNVIVNHLDRGSTWDPTVTGQGVLWKWDHLVSET